MGSIFKRKGRSGWYASFKDAAGKFQQAALGTTDEKVAKRMLASIETRLETGDANGTVRCAATRSGGSSGAARSSRPTGSSTAN